ncbi:MAG: sugar phosphate isomerase/epimerase, partial [Flavisolibacter sp.]|nr:sugar phosphate isomerase/epimerase [Flavisolibacter sp.]
MLNRRTFLQLSSTIAAGTILTRCGERTTMTSTIPPLNHIGLQLFSIPKLLEQDFAGTLKMIAQTGYKELEFYGPYPFSAAEDVERWKSVTPSLGFSGSGFFGLTVQQVKKILDDNGLSAPSLHTNLATL